MVVCFQRVHTCSSESGWQLAWREKLQHPHLRVQCNARDEVPIVAPCAIIMVSAAPSTADMAPIALAQDL